MKLKFIVFVILMLLIFFAGSIFAQTPVAMSPAPWIPFLSSTGAPLAGGCVFTYISGTSTPLATYTDGSGSSQNTNPVILDIGGFANIWLANASYRFTIYSAGGTNCATGSFQRTVDRVSAYTIINQAQNIFLTCASADPAGTAGEFGCRNDLTNRLRYFSVLWDSVVTDNVAATLLNKTLSGPIITNPQINGPSIGTGVQGTEAKLMTAGVVTGIGATLCSSSLGGATTAGCNAFPQVVYSTQSVSTFASLPNTNLVTAGSSVNTYRVTFNVIVSAVGTSCSGNSTLQIDLLYTDPLGSSANGHVPVFMPSSGATTLSQPFVITTNGATGVAQSQAVTAPDIINVHPATTVFYNTLYTPGASCSPAPSYQVTPIVEVLK